MKKYLALLIACCCFGSIGCDKKSSPENAKERAAAEGEAQNDVDNKNQAQKAQAMESDLAERHSFYSAIEGEYEGAIKIGSDTYMIKMIVVRSIPPYTGDRVRQLSEIELDINALFLQGKIDQWHPADLASMVRCKFNGLRPNMELGTMTLATNDCANFYQISLSEDDIFDLEQKPLKAKQLANKIKNGEVRSVPYLIGVIQPANNPNKYNFIAKRAD